MSNRIGRYEIQAELGRGGFGRVFRAYDPTVGRLVAIKTLNTSGEQDMLTRFRNEAAATGRLHHQNIVVVFDFGEHDGAPFLVMELLDGEDIERVITNGRPITLLKKLDIIMQASAGLQHAHSKGIVHRDVKPANIMLMADGSVKIMDFGIALLSQATAERITPQGSMIGTLPYMAPEQFFGSPSGVMTDIFAFGVTCYKLLTGVHPFQAPELGAMMNNIANVQQVPLRTRNPECPEALEQLVNRLLAKNPDLRYQTLEDMQFDLEPVVLDLRRESVGELLVQTRSLIAADQLDSAQSIVRQVFEIDPGNRTARELRETIQRQIRERALRPKITALVTAGREQLQVRQFDEAIQKFESALVLDKSNQELQRLIEQARAAAERARRADQLLEEAGHALHRDDLTSAHKNIADALAADPDHARAESLLADVQRRLELRRREQRLLDGLAHLKGLMLLQSFGEAIDDGIRLQQEFPESGEVRKILERARQEQEAQARQARLQAAVAETKELLRNHRYAVAVQRLAQLRREFPEAQELRDLASYAAVELQAQKTAEVVARSTAETRTLVAAGQFDKALEQLERALGEYPGLNALRDLVEGVASKKADHQRKLALSDAIEQGGALVASERFTEALERIDAFVRAYGERAELNAVRQRAEEGLEHQRRAAALRKLISDAQSSLDEDQPRAALQALEQATVHFPGNSELTNMLGLARNRLREQQQDEAISKIIADAESNARSKRFDQALAIVDEAQRQYGAAERLVRCAEAIVASQAAYQRDRARREMIERVRSLQAEGKAVEALLAIETTQGAGVQDEDLIALKRQIEADIAERKRAEELRRILADAQSLADSGRLDAARKQLSDAARIYPGEPRFKTLLEQIEARLQQQQRAEAIAKAVAGTRAHLGSGEFDRAIQLIDEAVRRWGSDPALAQARETAVAAKSAHEAYLQQQERAAAVARVLRDAEAQTAKKEFDKAIKQIDDALRRLGLEPALAQARETAVAAKTSHEAYLQQQERAAAIARALRDAEAQTAKNEADKAIKLIDDALRRLGPDPALAQARDSAGAAKAAHEARLQQQERAAAIAKILRDAEAQTTKKEFDKAIKLIDEAGRRLGPESAFAQARETVVAAKRAHQLALAQTRAEELQKDGRFAEAIKEIAAAIQNFGEDPTLAALQRELQAQNEASKRDSAAQNAVLEAQDLLNRQDPASAIQVLQRAPAQSVHQDRIAELLAEAQATLRQQQHDQAIALVIENVDKLRSQREFDRALQALEAGCRQFPGAEKLVELRRSVSAEKVRAESLAKAGRLYRDGQLEAAMKETQNALLQCPGDPELSQLKAGIEADQSRQKRAADIRKTLDQANALVAKDRLADALALLQAAAAQYSGEQQVADLLRTVEQELQKRTRAKELEDVTRQARTFLSQGKFEEVVSLIESCFPQERSLQELKDHAQKEVDARRREALVQQAIATGREKRYEDAIRIVEQAVSQYGPTETTEKLHHSLRSSLEQHLKRQARDRDQAQLLSLEQQVGTRPRKGKLGKISAEVQAIAARYDSDTEIAQIAGRILEAASAQAAQTQPGVPPRLLIGGGIGVVALIGGGVFLMRTPAPRPSVTIPVEIVTHPAGASVTIQDRSCVTPDCRFELKPGPSEVKAQLKGYQPLRKAVTVDGAKGKWSLDLTLEPVASPPPLDTSAATGTLVVNVGVPDVLVSVDGVMRNRTDASGTLSLPLEAKTHEVSVERSGYSKAPAQTVSLAKGARQVVNFTLVAQNAKLELRGAPRGVEVRLGGKLLGVTDGSPSVLFPASPGLADQTVRVSQGATSRSLQQKFEPGQTVRLDWKDVAPGAPPPNPEAIEKQDWDRVHTTTDIAQLRNYLNSHPNGAHAKDAAARIADLTWANVDQNNIEAVRRFAKENPDNPHKTDAQRLIDQYDAAQQRLTQQQREKQDKARLEQARQEQLKQDQIKQEQARQEQARQEQAKLEQAKKAQELDRAKLDQANKQPVLDVLRRFDSALQRKRQSEVKALWPTASSTFLESLRSPQVEMSLVAAGDVQFPQPDRAIIHCDLVVGIKAGNSAPKHQRAAITLRSAGGGWTIEQLKIE